MDEFDDEPVSLPCSNGEAKIGMPVMVQLHLVDAALKKNPLPREDFYRQYSITPERRTPEGEHTPPPPTYSPGIILAQEKAWARGVAETLKQFHAGRVKLRKEEAERHGTLEESPEYWSLQGEKWQGELWKLMKEMGKRKKQELKGEADEGYAQAMLLSPLQSPSPPPSNGSLPESLQDLKTTGISDGLPEISTQPHARLMQKPLQPIPERSPDHFPTPTKGQKRLRVENEDHEEMGLHPTSRAKRQRREKPTAQQKQEPIPAIKSTKGKLKDMSEVSRIKVRQDLSTRKRTAPSAGRTLPWNVRSGDVISYPRTCMKTTIQNRGYGGKKTYQRKLRLPKKRGDGRTP